MAVFGSLGARSRAMPSMFPSQDDRLAQMGVVPYAPTPEERASAIPGNFAAMQPQAPTGMFGSRLGGSIQAALQAAAPDPAPGGVLAGALANSAAAGQSPRSPLADAIDVPTQPMQINTDIAPIDLSNVKVKHPGFFQHGGLGEKILHGVGEFALRYSASQGDPFATMTLRNRFEQHQQQLRLLEQVNQRQADRDEWMWREQWKRQHPDDQLTQYMQAAGIDPASPQGQALYRQRAESMAAPPLMAVDGFDAHGNPTKTFMPRPTLGAGSPGTSGGSGPAVGTVRNGFRFTGGNPNDRASWQPVGGAAPTASAPFGR